MAIDLSIPVIAGPTAAGKSALALQLADARSGIEIVSADSRQIYRGLDIGTAKPGGAERLRIPHHFIDIIDPSERYSAGRFASDARNVLDDIIARGNIPIVVGGTGFYIEALFHGVGAPPASPETMALLEQRLDREGLDALLEELRSADREAYQRVDRSNPARVIRALACWTDSGRPFSEYRSLEESYRFEPTVSLILPDRSELYERINQRVVEMIEAGLVDEVRRLIESGLDPDAPGLRTVGYREALAHLEGSIPLDEMIASIQQATRRYAKRQLTWFRNRGTVSSHHPSAADAFENLLQQIDAFDKEKARNPDGLRASR